MRAFVSIFVVLVLNVSEAAPLQLPRQLIIQPANASAPHFADIDGDGRSDLLVIDPVEKRVLNYHQRRGGFTNATDQVISLPSQTAWVGPCDVDAHPGLELLISTATGLIYLRQKAGLFESERRTLIEASQVFTNVDLPILTSLTNDLIPVISAGQTVLYQRNSAYEWTPKPPMALEVKQTAWHIHRDRWMMGPNPAYSLRSQQSLRIKPDQDHDQGPENEGIRKAIDDMRKKAAASPPFTNRVDVDGDSREDLILWQMSGKMDVKTDIYLFLRGPDQQLPARPTLILHRPGFPIPLGSTEEASPVNDLNGDGICELVLLDPKIGFTSPGRLLEIALSHGVDWSLTIRSFHRGAFAGNAGSIEVTTIMPPEDLEEWPICIHGDFNGDRRADLLVRRSETTWHILFSTTDKRWFAPQPAMTFEAPARGRLQVNDLNGDGLADIIWREPDEARLSIFMSSPRQAKSKNP